MKKNIIFFITSSLVITFLFTLNGCEGKKIEFNTNEKIKNTIRYSIARSLFYKNCVDFNFINLERKLTIEYYKKKHDESSREIYIVSLPSNTGTFAISSNLNNYYFEGCVSKETLPKGKSTMKHKIVIDSVEFSEKYFLETCDQKNIVLVKIKDYLTELLEESDKHKNNIFYIGPFSISHDSTFYCYWKNKKYIYIIKNPYSFLNNDEIKSFQNKNLFFILNEREQNNEDLEKVNKIINAGYKIEL